MNRQPIETAPIGQIVRVICPDGTVGKGIQLRSGEWVLQGVPVGSHPGEWIEGK